jgi:DNA uptake protein ComE-like DNA-binding protein
MKKALVFLGMVGVGAFLSTAYLARRRRVSSGAQSGLLDLNHASEEDLIERCGLEPELAFLVVENRPYATKIDLIGRRIIPDSNYQAIKHLVTVAHVA